MKNEISQLLSYVYVNEYLDEIKNNSTLKSMLKKTPFVNQGKLSDLKCYECDNNYNLTLSRFISKSSSVLIINIVYGGLINIDSSKFNLMYKNVDREINLNEIFEFVVKNKTNITYKLRLFLFLTKRIDMF